MRGMHDVVPHHTVKCDPDAFQAVVDGVKLAEYRLDDREPRYAAGQIIELVEYDREAKTHTGRWQRVRILHVTRGPHVPPGFVMWSHVRDGFVMPEEIVDDAGVVPDA